MRVYQGKFQKGNYLYNSRTGKRVRISRLVQMHADKMEVGPASICEMHNSSQFPTDLENVISRNHLTEFSSEFGRQTILIDVKSMCFQLTNE